MKEGVGSKAAAHVVTKLEAAECITDEHLEAAHRDDLAAAQLVILILILFLYLILKQQKQADSGAATGQLLPPSTISQLRNACFMVKGDGEEFVGAGVFFKSGVAITAWHNLPKHAKKGSMVSIRMAKGGTSTPMQRQLKVVSLTRVRDESDFAVMKSEEETEFIPMWQGDVQELEVCKVFICAFHLGLNEHLLGLKFDEAKLKIVEGTSVGTSTDARFFLYTSNTFRGDSGAGIVTVGGELIGIHLAGVNSIRHAKLHGSQQPAGIEELVSNMVELASSHASSAVNTGNAQIGLLLRTLDL